jgi:hypothetical protein
LRPGDRDTHRRHDRRCRLTRHKVNPDDFPKLVWKLMELDTTLYAWSEEDIPAIATPNLIVLGDSDGACLSTPGGSSSCAEAA